MTPNEFVGFLQKDIVEDNTAIYRGLFEKTSDLEATDPYWKKALGLYHALTAEQKAVFFDVVRQITVDAVSNVLGVIDGVNSLTGIGGEFELKFKGAKLNGDLQSLFLIQEERLAKSR